MIICHSAEEINRKADALIEQGFQVEREAGVQPVQAISCYLMACDKGEFVEASGMKYSQQITLKNGSVALLRNGVETDGSVMLEIFQKTHGETDYLRSYPDERNADAEQEGQFLAQKAASSNEIEIIALVDGKVAGSAGIHAVGTKYKVRHRCEFGISVLKEYWGLGIGSALTEACIQCAKEAGYAQLELAVVAENERAIALYQKEGFVEYGRNPRGFHSRISGFQEVVYMLLTL